MRTSVCLIVAERVLTGGMSAGPWLNEVAKLAAGVWGMHYIKPNTSAWLPCVDLEQQLCSKTAWSLAVSSIEQWHCQY